MEEIIEIRLRDAPPNKPDMSGKSGMSGKAIDSGLSRKRG